MKYNKNYSDFPIEEGKYKLLGNPGLDFYENGNLPSLINYTYVPIACLKKDITCEYKEIIEDLLLIKYNNKDIHCHLIDNNPILIDLFKNKEQYLHLLFFCELKSLCIYSPYWFHSKFLFQAIRGYFIMTSEIEEKLKEFSLELSQYDEKRKKWPTVIKFSYKKQDLDLIYSLLNNKYEKYGFLTDKNKIENFKLLSKNEKINCLEFIISVKAILYEILPNLRKGNINFSLVHLYIKYAKKMLNKHKSIDIKLLGNLYLNLNSAKTKYLLNFIKKYKSENFDK